MLKLIARVFKPTSGRVVVRGQVAPLLEFGAGFHPELTGRENIYLNGALMGFSRQEMEEKFEGIVDFAELWDFIDVPLRTYSSGMGARLGFAVATDVEPDILLIDEVLSVGDESFQRKSSARMQEFRDQGATIILVSHVMEMIQSMCSRAAWLDHGQIKAVGKTSEVVQAYLQNTNE
jgi:ABC-2 type transport system ATP-binding protein/lipopolysaccharide transport system ATP-binding protein